VLADPTAGECAAGRASALAESALAESALAERAGYFTRVPRSGRSGTHGTRHLDPEGGAKAYTCVALWPLLTSPRAAPNFTLSGASGRDYVDQHLLHVHVPSRVSSSILVEQNRASGFTSCRLHAGRRTRLVVPRASRRMLARAILAEPRTIIRRGRDRIPPGAT